MVSSNFFKHISYYLFRAYSFSCLHEDYESEMPRLFEDQLIANGPGGGHFRRLICQEWHQVQDQLSCCAPTTALQACRLCMLQFKDG